MAKTTFKNPVPKYAEVHELGGCIKEWIDWAGEEHKGTFNAWQDLASRLITAKFCKPNYKLTTRRVQNYNGTVTIYFYMDNCSVRFTCEEY